MVYNTKMVARKPKSAIITTLANMSTLTSLLNVIFPPRCLMCKTPTQAHPRMCSDCWDKLTFITTHSCYKCGIPVEQGHTLEHNYCGNCIAHMPPYRCARAVWVYDNHIRPFITRFKYSDYTIAAPFLAQQMVHQHRSLIADTDLIVPVPLHWTRLLKRRYNQAALLAYYMSKQTHIPYTLNACVRAKATRPQYTLSKAGRMKNVSGVFHVKPKHSHRIANKHILLIDDVMTSGATITACTKALLKHGAKEVSVLTCARTPL